MKKINCTISDEANEIIRLFQKKNNISNKDEALDEILRKFVKKK